MAAASDDMTMKRTVMTRKSRGEKTLEECIVVTFVVLSG